MIYKNQSKFIIEIEILKLMSKIININVIYQVGLILYVLYNFMVGLFDYYGTL